MGRRLAAVPLVILILAGSACGDDDSDGGDAAPTTTEAPSTAGPVEELIAFDLAAQENPEGLAVDESGDLYISLSPLGKVVRVRDGETTTEDVGTIPIEANDFGPLGLALDGDDVLVAVQSATSGGVWRFPKDGGEGERIAGTEAIGFANDLTVGDDGAIYVASSVEGTDDSGAHLGAVWRIADGEVEQWLVSPMLGGTGTTGLPAPIGANGITARDDTLYVANTEQGQIVAVPMGDDGEAGEPTVFLQDAQLGGADGITFDDDGNLYVAVIGQSTIVRIDADDQAVTAVAGDDDGLDYPSTVKFGAGEHDGDLLALNYAIGALIGDTSQVEGPGLLLITLPDE